MNKKTITPKATKTTPTSPLALIPLPNGVKIRTTPDGKVSVFDVIREATGAKYPRMTWASISSTYPEVVKLVDGYKFEGKGQQSTPVVDKAGFLRILHFLRGKVGEKFRNTYDQFVIQASEGDPALAAAILDRNPNPEEALAWVITRQEVKEGNKEFNHTVYAHKGDNFADLAIITSLGATGKTPKQLRAERGGNEARDAMTRNELAGVRIIEALSTAAINITNAVGNTAIMTKHTEIAHDTNQLIRKHAGRTFGVPDIQSPKKFAPKPAAPPSPQLSLF